MSARRRALLLALPALLGACHGPDAAGAPKRPRIELVEPKHRFERMVQEQEARHAFVVRNGGTAPLLLEQPEPSPNCSGSLSSQSLAPGDGARLEVACRPRLYGPFRESLGLRSNDPDAPQSTLELSGDAVPLLAFERDQVDFDLAFGESRRESVRVTGVHAAAARLSLLDPGPCASVGLLPPDAGRNAGIELRPDSSRAGTRVGQIRIGTGLERPTELDLRITCSVRGTLQVSPTNPYFDLGQPGPKVRWIELSSTAPGFRVESVRVIEGPFSASVEPTDSPQRYRVKVVLLEQRLERGARGVVGKLLVSSSDRTEPRREIPLFGMGEPTRSAAE